MHSRRLGAFLIGAWLVGTILMIFVTTQALANVNRVLTNPPLSILGEIEEIGPPVVQRLFRIEAIRLNRHIVETWEFVQLGLGAALLAISICTVKRNRLVIVMAGAMTGIVLLMAFYITPTINSLERTFDPLQPTVIPEDTATVGNHELFRTILEVIKSGMGLVIAVRLIGDWHGSRLPGEEKSSNRRRVRVRRSSSRSGSSAGYESQASPNASRSAEMEAGLPAEDNEPAAEV